MARVFPRIKATLSVWTVVLGRNSNFDNVRGSEEGMQAPYYPVTMECAQNKLNSTHRVPSSGLPAFICA